MKLCSTLMICFLFFPLSLFAQNAPADETTPSSVWNAGQIVQGSLGGMEFAYIPSGMFLVGSPEDEFGRDADEDGQHQVAVAAFFLQTTEVTRGQWNAVMGNVYEGEAGEMELPVSSVSLEEALQYIDHLNEMDGTRQYRLPTEIEWEYACRAGTDTRFFNTDNEEMLAPIAWYAPNSENRLHRVGQTTPNAWGLYDMHGNVWEWCNSPYLGSHNDFLADQEKILGEIEDTLSTDNEITSEEIERVVLEKLYEQSDLFVFRGGCYKSLPAALRCANRGASEKWFRGRAHGFRIAWTVPEEMKQHSTIAEAHVAND